MASSLPVLSGREVVRAFQQFGWQVARQKASHIILIKPGHIATLSVPDHNEVIRDADLTVQEFVRAVR